MTDKTPDPCGSDSSTEFGVWQPIETAPQDGTKVLGYFTINGISFIGVIWWIKDIHKEDEVHWRMALDNSSTRGYASGLRNDGATHWMRLPPPPNAEAQGRR